MSDRTAYRVGLENGIEGRSLAWVLGHPGCFSYGADGEEALGRIPEAIQDYRNWIAGHAGERWQVSGTGWDDSPAFDTVLRNAMATDGAGTVVVGTTGGNIWTTRDAGDTWKRADLQLPRILSVEFV